jgi:hypothetical protein
MPQYASKIRPDLPTAVGSIVFERMIGARQAYKKRWSGEEGMSQEEELIRIKELLRKLQVAVCGTAPLHVLIEQNRP